MIRPTRRAILLFACGIPLALVAIASDETLWQLGLYFSILVILAVIADAVLAFPMSAAKPDFNLPDKLYIGDQGTLTIDFPA